MGKLYFDQKQYLNNLTGKGDSKIATTLIGKLQNLEPRKVRIFMVDPDHYSQAFKELIVEQHLSMNMGRITISLNKIYDEFYSGSAYDLLLL